MNRILGKKLVLSMSVLGSLLVSAGALRAGLKETPSAWEVKIEGTTKGRFQGYLGSARNSTDSMQYIGCFVDWSGPTENNLATVSPSNSGWCEARDRYGNARGCYVTIKYGTASALLGNVIQDSYIDVNYFTVSGVPYCGAIKIYNYSSDPVKY
jgi:hypothetical protein